MSCCTQPKLIQRVSLSCQWECSIDYFKQQRSLRQTQACKHVFLCSLWLFLVPVVCFTSGVLAALNACSKCSKAKTPDAKQTPEQQEQRIKVLQGQLSSPVWALSIFGQKMSFFFGAITARADFVSDPGNGDRFCVRSWQRGQILCQILATGTDFVSDPGNEDRFCVRSWQRGQILCQILTGSDSNMTTFECQRPFFLFFCVGFQRQG